MLTPPDITKGNYRSAAGEFLDATETVGWIDSDGEFIAKPLDLVPLSAELQVSPSVFEPVDLAQKPTEETVVTGSFSYVYEREDPPVSVSESSEIKTTVTTSFDFSAATRTTTTETELLGSVIYEPVSNVGPFPTGKTLSTRVEDIDQYDPSAEGKLISKTISTDTRKIAAHGTLAGWLANNDTENGLDGTGQETLGNYSWSGMLLPGNRDRTQYEYDSRGVIEKVTRTVSASRGEILGRLGSNMDWSVIDARVALDGLVTLERETETWINHGDRDWERRTRRQVCKAAHESMSSNLVSRFQVVEELFDSGLLTAAEKGGRYETLIDEALTLIDVEPQQPPDRKTDGSLAPPETQRKPSRFYVEDGQVTSLVGFPQLNPQGEIRSDSAQIPYLPDANGDAISSGDQVQKDRAESWALKRSALAIGRYRARKIKAPIPPGMLSNFEPFNCFDVTRNGRTYRLALDGLTWTMTRTACYFECDAPLLMIGPAGGPLEPPYTQIRF
ncbi:MAG: hypothetical protein HC771_22955 [Synechococcales cyanobacterium CRU_2_2]|nr:hypothetical protein [Synechococcales cyanobacterium CRU_2_2]